MGKVLCPLLFTPPTGKIQLALETNTYNLLSLNFQRIVFFFLSNYRGNTSSIIKAKILVCQLGSQHKVQHTSH